MPCMFTWTLVGPFTLISSFAFSLFKLIFFAAFFLLPSANYIHRSWSFSLCSVNAFNTTFAKAALVDIHNLVKISFFHIITFLLNALLELWDHLNIFFFLLMFVLHLKIFECFMEFLVFSTEFFLFKSFDLYLLLKQATFNFDHMIIIFEHLRVKIVRSAYGDISL